MDLSQQKEESSSVAIQNVEHYITHTGEKTYECLICQKKLNSKGALNRHAKRHNNEEPLECTDSHKKVHAFECTVCPKKFLQKSHLTRHVRIHTGEKPYECDVCHKKCTTKDNLAKHISKGYLRVLGLLLKAIAHDLDAHVGSVCDLEADVAVYV